MRFVLVHPDARGLVSRPRGRRKSHRIGRPSKSKRPFRSLYVRPKDWNGTDLYGLNFVLLALEAVEARRQPDTLAILRKAVRHPRPFPHALMVWPDEVPWLRRGDTARIFARNEKEAQEIASRTLWIRIRKAGQMRRYRARKTNERNAPGSNLSGSPIRETRTLRHR